ncbi:MAG: hypothetical protein ACTIM4_13565 [Marinomonas sp.]|uniref:hypothetical protein n=1 Tax=Marinomonas sp. TaxID=1904862 RepID=UPI003F9674FB
MKKKLLAASLKLVPNGIQHKAMAKALNYLFYQQPVLARFAGLSIRLQLMDITQDWTFVCDGRGFSQCKTDKADVVCMFSSDLALELVSVQGIARAIEQGSIEFVGEPEDIDNAKAMLLGIEANRLEKLSQQLRSFLRIKPA